MTAVRAEAGYTARHLSVLEGLEAVRKRPGMYIGSTDSRGLMHCLWEIVDNAVDEALGGYCTRIEVELYPDGSIEVRDNGRGIPVDIEPRTGLPGVELVYTKLHAGGKFGGGSYGATGGLHGVGASVVNALSSRLDVEVDRDGRVHQISFRRGVPGMFDGEGPNAKFRKKSGLRDGGPTEPGVTGTRVRWWPDRKIFLPDAEISLDEVRVRLRQTAFLVPGLTLMLRDGRGEEVVEETFAFQGGIAEFTEFLAPDEPVCDMLRLQGTGHFHETVPVLDEQGHMVLTEVERELEVDVALRWGKGYDTDVRSFVNMIATPKGGTHVAGFERALVRTVNEQLRATQLLRTATSGDQGRRARGPHRGRHGAAARAAVRGQTKEVLGTAAATPDRRRTSSPASSKPSTTPKRGQKQQLRAVLEKIVGAAQARVAAREQQDCQRRKTALETSSLPAKLVDCRSDDVERSELFIVEGDSALGTAKLARDSEFQALLPIRGKILNVQKASVADMLKNAECASIIQVVGAGSGRTFDLEAARYGKVILMADADVDGAHIRCLLLTLFHRYMRPMLRPAGCSPRCRRCIASRSSTGKGQDKYVYTYSDAELQRILADLDSRASAGRSRCSATRASVRWTPTSSPRRRWTRATAPSAGSASRTPRTAERIFELLMGSEVGPRREFIVEDAAAIDREHIDA